MITGRFCERLVADSVVLPAEPRYRGSRDPANVNPSIKEMVPIESNTIVWVMRSAGRLVAASPALPANACTTPAETYPVTCSIPDAAAGSLSQIVTTQVTHPGT